VAEVFILISQVFIIVLFNLRFILYRLEKSNGRRLRVPAAGRSNSQRIRSRCFAKATGNFPEKLYFPSIASILIEEYEQILRALHKEFVV
jgi:hypothetical protein